MRITGYRRLSTVHEWGRPIGDANGIYLDGRMPVSLLLIDTDEGVTGVGIGNHLMVDEVFPSIVGEDPRAVSALYDKMLRWTFKAGHSGVTFGAVGVIDTALWDIKAKLLGQPLWRLLGGRDRVVPAYASALDAGLTDDELLTTYKTYAERGLMAAKLKGGLDVEADRHRLRLVRDLFREYGRGRRPALMLDANEAWNRKQAVRHIRALEQGLDLTWVEEPVRRWDAEGLALVSRGVQAAVASGENLSGLEQFRPLIAAQALDIVQTAAVWGVTHFLRAANLAHAHDLPMSPIGTTPVGLVHAATSIPNHLVTELQDLQPPFGVALDYEIADGGFILGEEPGLGVSVDEDKIAALGSQTFGGIEQSPGVRPERAGCRLLAEPPSFERLQSDSKADEIGEAG